MFAFQFGEQANFNFRKLACFIVAAALVLATCGCGNTSDSGSAQTQLQPTPANAPAVSMTDRKQFYAARRNTKPVAAVQQTQ